MAESTRDRIMNAAFSFYEKPVFENVSLSQIAQKVGISKAAIFKHFASKDELTAAMSDRLYDDIAAAVTGELARYSDRQAAVPHIVDFLAGHRPYIFFLLCTKQNFTENSFMKELRKRGIRDFDQIYADDGSVKDRRRYFLSIFFAITLLVFIMGKFRMDDSGKTLPDVNNFSCSLARFLSQGIGTPGAGCSSARLDELDRKCSQGMDFLAPAGRDFIALATVLSVSGFQRLTVEKIAAELGMAKSSLYFRYENKLDLVCSVIRGELRNLYNLILHNMEGLQDTAEKRYAMFRTELLYFLQRPQFCNVMKALFSEMGMPESSGQDAQGKEAFGAEFYGLMDSAQLLPGIPGFGESESVRKLSLCWFFLLPWVSYIHCRCNDFPEAVIQQSARYVYALAEQGTGAAYQEVVA